MILLALCLIQASAASYYFKICFSNENGGPERWTSYIPVGEDDDNDKVYDNGLRKLLNGETVKDEYHVPEALPKTADNKVNLDKIYGIAFANGKGLGKSDKVNILPGDEYDAWTEICSHIKYLELRYYKLDTYTNKGYFMNMHNVEELELPKDGMTVGDGVDDCQYYFANADKLKKIFIWDGNNGHVDITDNTVTSKPLLNRVGKFMFSNCYSLSTKYINRLIKDVTEIKNNAFSAGNEHREDFSNEADNKIPIEIPNSVTKIGDQAFWNRVKVTGLNIHDIDGGCLDIGSEAFKGCDELAKISLTQDNTKLQIHDYAFEGCKQLNAFESMNKAKITDLGTGVFRYCQSMTNKFVNGVLENYAANGEKEKKIPAYLFFCCNGQNFTQLDIPASFTQIDKGAFAKNSNVTKIIVHSGTQIDAQTYDGEDGIFYGMIPNKVQVVFEGEAEAHYTFYRDNIKDKGPNAFMSLLTKTLNENDEDYTVVAQRHADVHLTRTFKAGWNTLVLPFGGRDEEGKCARIFQKALNASGEENGAPA